MTGPRATAELNYNVTFEQRGHLTLAHNDGSLRTMRWRAEVNKLEGIDSERWYDDRLQLGWRRHIHDERQRLLARGGPPRRLLVPGQRRLQTDPL